MEPGKGIAQPPNLPLLRESTAHTPRTNTGQAIRPGKWGGEGGSKTLETNEKLTS